MIEKIRALSAENTFTDIAKILDEPFWKITKLAKQEGIKSKYMLATEKRINKVIRLKKRGLNYLQISRKLGVARGTVANIYYRINYKLDGPGSGSGQERKVKENPFYDVFNPTTQYWLGMLAADGNLSSTKYSIRLSQSSERAEVLEEYRRFLNGDDIKIFITKGEKAKKDTHLIVFGNKLIHTFLNTLGFTSRKSHTLDITFPITWDFIRGYFDGDGSAKYYKNGGYTIKITCSNSIMISKIEGFFNKEYIKNYITYKDKINCPEQRDIHIKAESREIFYKKMYYDNTLFCVKAKRAIIEQSIIKNSVNSGEA